MSTKKEIAKIIREHTSFWNGWAVGNDTVKRECRKAAKKILKLDNIIVLPENAPEELKIAVLDTVRELQAAWGEEP